MKPRLHPEDCLSLRLRMVNRKVNKIFSDYTRKVDLTPSQQTILLFLWKVKRIRQSQLGRELELERSTVNRELRGLMKKGYLNMYTGSGHLISLTAIGRKFVRKLLPGWEQANMEVREILGAEGIIAAGILFDKVKEQQTTKIIT